MPGIQPHGRAQRQKVQLDHPISHHISPIVVYKTLRFIRSQIHARSARLQKQTCGHEILLVALSVETAKKLLDMKSLHHGLTKNSPISLRRLTGPLGIYTSCLKQRSHFSSHALMTAAFASSSEVTFAGFMRVALSHQLTQASSQTLAMVQMLNSRQAEHHTQAPWMLFQMQQPLQHSRGP